MKNEAKYEIKIEDLLLKYFHYALFILGTFISKENLPHTNIWRNKLIQIKIYTIEIKKQGDLKTPWFCKESLHCDMWLSEPLVRHNTTPFLLF